MIFEARKSMVTKHKSTPKVAQAQSTCNGLPGQSASSAPNMYDESKAASGPSVKSKETPNHNSRFNVQVGWHHTLAIRNTLLPHENTHTPASKKQNENKVDPRCLKRSPANRIAFPAREHEQPLHKVFCAARAL